MSNPQGLRVFLADDSSLMTKRLSALLAPVEGVQIVGIAHTTSAAIRGIQHLLPELVILDFQMPDGNGLEVLKAIKQGDRSPLVMMLTNFGYPPYRAECMQRGANYFFDKSQDFELVVKTCQQLASPTTSQVETVSRVIEQADLPTIVGQQTTDPSRPKHVLVVEDDDVNRWLAARLLEQKGYRVKTVTNGEAALAAVESETFDLILMDIYMPLLDGLAATRIIRQRERHTGTRVPIIAFTSEPGSAQAQHYWQIGMDSYLLKPIHTDEFYRTIEAVLTLHQRLSQATRLPLVFDVEEALHQVGGDFELLQQVAERFFNTAPHLVAAMRRAIAKDDPYNLDFAAHRLRGLASNVSAHAVIELAERLELMGSIRNMSQAQLALTTLEQEVERFRLAFEAAQQKLLAQS